MWKRVAGIIFCTGLLVAETLTAQRSHAPMVTLRQPRFNLGIRGGFNSSMFFTDHFSVGGQELEDMQNNYKVGYFGSFFCRFNLKRHHFIQPEIAYNVLQGSISIPYTLSNSEVLKETGLIKSRATIIDIPLLYGYKFVDVHPYGMAFMVGPKVGWVWEAHSKNEYTGFYQQSINEHIEPFRYSAVVGLAVNVSNIFFDFRYEVGLHNVTQRISYDVSQTEEPYSQYSMAIKRRLNVLSFSVGVIF